MIIVDEFMPGFISLSHVATATLKVKVKRIHPILMDV